MSTLAMQDFRTAMLMKSGIFMQRAIKQARIQLSYVRHLIRLSMIQPRPH